MTTGNALSDLINERMTEKNLSIRGLAEKLGTTYEHTRRISKGVAIPPNVVLRAICHTLDMNVDEVEKVAVAARIRLKHGALPEELTGKDPELEPIERVWKSLSAQQKNDAVLLIQGWAKKNKAHRA